MRHFSARKKFDLFVVLGLTFAAAFISLLLRVDIVISVLLYLGIPSLYLCFRERKNILKILAASLVIGVLLGMAYNIIAETTGAWTVRYEFFPFNQIVIESTQLGDFVWGFLILFSAITFYKHFLDDERTRKFSKYSTLGLGLGLVTFFLTVSLLMNDPTALHLTYGYAILGTLSVLPLALLLFARRALLYKVLLVMLYFFFVNFLFELTALEIHQWSFPGHYIILITMFGVQFPIEELLFWILLGVPSLIVCYEFLFDDGK